MFSVTKTGTFNDENQDSNTQVGETITYNISIINTGSEPVSNIKVADDLITNQSLNNTINYASGDINTNSILDAGETWIYSATYNITAQDIMVGELENHVIVTGMNPDGEEEMNDDFETVDLPSYIIEIEKLVLNDPNSFAPGDQVDFIIQVTNRSNVAINNVVINDSYNAAELTFDPSANLAADLGNDNEWIVSVPGSISTIIDFIPSGGIGFVFVNFGIPRTFMGDAIKNIASINSFDDPEGNSTSDPNGPVAELPEDEADVIVDQDPAIFCVEQL
ncbi:MAG: hypothetical protein IPO48_06360 [Saprospiraceae bacterium]|nr:hypothetical protein [Saprospiraceae bacterium]